MLSFGTCFGICWVPFGIIRFILALCGVRAPSLIFRVIAAHSRERGKVGGLSDNKLRICEATQATSNVIWFFNAIGNALAMVLPQALQAPFLKEISKPGDELTEIKLSKLVEKTLPSASLVQRYELSLDVAMVLLTRILKRRMPAGEKFSLCDSSPVGEHDWIWSLYYHISRERIIPLFKAVTTLKISIEKYVSDLRPHNDECDAAPLTMDELTFVDESWKPLLREIRTSMVCFINTPCAMASGHSKLPDKVSAEVYKMHLATPSETFLEDEAATFRCNTSDMGVEAGLPTFKADSVEGLLPEWVERRSLDVDVEGLPCDVDAGGPEPRQENQSGTSDGDALDIDIERDSDVDVGERILELDVDCNAEDPPPEAPAPQPCAQQLPTAPRGTDLYPNAYSIYGFQHKCDNLNADVNERMPHFKEFWADLKQVEACLNLNYRLLTYIWTCIRKTRFAKYENRFMGFRASLYEARWHECVTFMKRFKWIVVIFAQTFDARRFLSGVDIDGQPNTKQSKKVGKQEELRGGVKFDPFKLERALKSSYFHYFMHMLLQVDCIPVQLAEKNSLCPCHMALLEGQESYKIRKILEAHYGRGQKTCPLAGMNIPELISDGVEEHVEKLKALAETEINLFIPPPGTAPMTDEQWGWVFEGFNHGCKCTLALLLLKSNYLYKPPVMIGGVACANEEEARQNAIKVRVAFAKDPRQEVHDPRTWRLMDPECDFKVNLDLFIDKLIPRALLSFNFQYEVAIFRFVLAIETLVERPHAKTSVKVKSHFQGPCRISLANRLPLLQQWIDTGVVSGFEVLEQFSIARKLLEVPELLGLSMHPSLGRFDEHGKTIKPAAYRRSLCNVLYRCDLIDMYRSQSKAAKKHIEEQKKQLQRAVKAMSAAKEPKLPVTRDRVMRIAMQDHMEEMMLDGRVLSCKADDLQFETLESSLNEPDSKRLKQDMGAARVGGLDVDRLEQEGPQDSDGTSGNQSPIFFQMVWQGIGRKKTVPIAIGAGGKLKQSASAVHIYEQAIPMPDDSFVLNSNAQVISTPTFILHGISEHATSADLIDNTKLWASSVEWTLSTQRPAGRRVLSKTPLPLDVRGHSERLPHLLSKLMNSRFRHSGPIGIKPLRDEESDIALLLSNGLVEKTDRDRFVATEKGLRGMSLTRRLRSPTSVFQSRDYIIDRMCLHRNSIKTFPN